MGKKNDSTCPACGYCSKCGRGGQQVQPFLPYWVPYHPYWQIPTNTPWVTYTIDTTTSSPTVIGDGGNSWQGT